MLLRDVARDHERSPGFFLVLPIQRQQAFPAQAIDFRQIQADAGFIDAGDCTVEVTQPIPSAARGEQNFCRKPQSVLWHGADRSRIGDFGVDHSGCVAGARAGRVDPAHQDQAPGAPRHQPEFVRQRGGSSGERRGCVPIADKLPAHGRIIERMSKRVWMLKGFGKHEAARQHIFDAISLAGHLERQRANDMRADTGIVTAERRTEMPMAGHVVGLHPDVGVGDSCPGVAAE